MKILGYNYSLDLSKRKSEMGGNVGYCNFDCQSLQIANDLNYDMFYSTLVHEIIEALNYHLELNLEHNQIMGIESGIYQTLVDGGIDFKPLISGKETVEA